MATFKLKPNFDKKGGSINSDEDKKVVAEIIDHFNAAAQNRQSLGIDQMFEECNAYYEGETNSTPEYEGDPCSETNIVKTLIESSVGDLVQAPFQIDVEPVEPSDEPYSGEVEELMSYIYKKNNPIIKLDMAERWRRKYGGVLILTGFDTKALAGFGMPTWEPIHPECFFPDPKVTRYDKLQDGDFHIIAEWVSVRWIKERFPKRGKYVTRDTQFSYQFPISGDKVESISGDMGDMVLYLCYWYKDDEGKLGLKIVADSELLYDSEKNEDQDDDFVPGIFENNKYPMVYIPRFIVDGQLWGSSDVKEIKKIQDNINDYDDQILLNAKLTGNNQVVVGKRAKINLTKWVAIPGLKIPAVDERAINQIQPKSIPYYIIEHRNTKKQEAGYITGREDVLEGRNAAGVRTASGIIALQEQANKKQKHPMTMFEAGFTEVMNLLFDYSLQFWDEFIPIRITKPNEDAVAKRETKAYFKWIDPRRWKNVPIKVPNPDSKTSEGNYELQDLIGEDGKVKTRQLELDINIRFRTGVDNSASFMYQSVIDLHRENLITTEEARYILKQIVNYPGINPFQPLGEFYDQSQSRMRQEEATKQANIQLQLDRLQAQIQQLQAPQNLGMGQEEQETSPIMDRTGFMDNTNMGSAGPKAGIFQQMAAVMGGRDV